MKTSPFLLTWFGPWRGGMEHFRLYTASTLAQIRAQQKMVKKSTLLSEEQAFLVTLQPPCLRMTSYKVEDYGLLLSMALNISLMVISTCAKEIWPGLSFRQRQNP